MMISKKKDDVLTRQEISELCELGKSIMADLDCCMNMHSGLKDESIPCRSCRFDAVEMMKKYIEIHGWKVSKT